MAQDGEKFLSRWSRRKLAAARTAAPVPAKAVDTAPTAAPLPPVNSLTYESDFTEFMRGKVEEGVKRAALKKLFADPRFNVIDGLDVYIDDYSVDDPIPEAMLARLEHAKSTLSGGKPPQEPVQEAAGETGEAVAASDTGPAPETAKTDDVDPRQDA